MEKEQKLFEIERLRCSYDKHYREGHSRVVLEIEQLIVPRGKKVFIVGESGIGKSTILETLGMMNDTIVDDRDMVFKFYPSPDKQVDMKKMWRSSKEYELSELRLKHFNFIFQSTNLMRNFTAYENVTFTRMLQGYSQYSCCQRARKIMAELGLSHVDEKRMAQELSGGQQQRLAFVRAILPDFTVLFGDEPTGNLDAENAIRVMQLLSNKLGEQSGASAIIVTHDMPLAIRFADIIIKIRKQHRSVAEGCDERISYGIIDKACLFVQSNESEGIWTNGIDDYPVDEFKAFLRS